MKYGAESWKGIWPQKARQLQKRRSHKKERQVGKKDLTPLYG